MVEGRDGAGLPCHSNSVSSISSSKQKPSVFKASFSHTYPPNQHQQHVTLTFHIIYTALHETLTNLAKTTLSRTPALTKQQGRLQVRKALNPVNWSCVLRHYPKNDAARRGRQPAKYALGTGAPCTEHESRSSSSLRARRTSALLIPECLRRGKLKTVSNALS